ncbi:hypothetical protein CERSUDRAFT_50369 [Gelatoporia subvermispora B]|uniref:DUF7727 domain-containing protein n=1 Tax=Ceriporiopsis subvermispora (strain B) TaxID=914234 RepID=M2PMG2_CERS8|nr:hypothetical protein CERSUDRAFT_50369 [Gelatoporia subvermispora B]
MGNLIWHEYARYVSLTATVYTVWASFWAFFYRKFFWDFVGGIVRTPGGIQPASNVSIFITLIVKTPVIPVLSMLHGLALIALEYPLPMLKNTAVHRSFVVRIIALLGQASLAILYYQGTNGALWSIVAAICYMRAQALGEKMKEAKANRGRGGKA